jgi:hypothetical protein
MLTGMADYRIEYCNESYVVVKRKIREAKMNDPAYQLEVASKLLTARTEDLRLALTRLSEIADALEGMAKKAREPLRSPQRAA